MACVPGLLAAASIGVGGAAAAGNVWVVDVTLSPGADYTTLQAAVGAAADGDTVLVRSGSYAGFTLSGKGLAIAADTGASVVITSTAQIWIQNVPAGSSVYLQGMQTAGARVLLSNNAGPVWLADMVIDASTASATPGVTASACASVALDRCTLKGSNGYKFQPFPSSGGYVSEPGMSALRVVDSSVAAFDCVFLAGPGQSANSQGTPGSGWQSSEGGAAIEVLSGHVQLSRCSATGGAGGAGDGFMFACNPPSAGGAGLAIPNIVGSAALSRTTLQAGLGGAAGKSPCSSFPGPDGAPYSGDPAAQIALPNLPQALAPALVREAQSASLQWEGPAGLALVAYGASGAPTTLQGFPGSLLLGAPVGVVVLGVLSSAGVASLPFTVAELGTGVESVRVHAQSVSCAASSGTCAIGEVRAIVLLDAAF